MISPPPGASSGGGSRRTRYTRSPSGGAPSSKRSKPSSSTDPYDRNHGSGADQNRLYTSICVKNMNPKISDIDVRELCNKKFSKYGTNSVKIYHKNQERVAFVNFTNCEDAKKARHAKTGLVWENMRVTLEPVYYRRTVPAEQPLNSGSPRDRSPPHRRHRRSSTRSPSPPPPPPPPVSSRGRYSSSSRHQRVISPPRSPPPTRSSRAPRRPYSPYIPLPPDLADYVSTAPSRHRQHSSPSPVRRHHHKHSSKSQRSRSPNSHRSASASPAHRAHAEPDNNGQSEPTRTLLVENLDRDVAESKLKETFGRYGTIHQINLKKSSSSSKRAHAFIEYENVDMAHKARQAMNGHLIGKVECKIRYGKIVPTRYLWVGNIPLDMKRRDLEHAFARYGQIKTLDYANGDPTAIVTYGDSEDAVKARTKLVGTLQLIDGQVIRHEGNVSPSSRRGFRFDYLDRPTTRRFVIVRPQYATTARQASPSPSAHSQSRESSVASSARSSVESQRSRSPSSEAEHTEKEETPFTESLKTEAHSPSPTPPPLVAIKQRRSTERSLSPPPADLSPIAGRSFYEPIGSYLSPKDTANVHNISSLMSLCEELNLSATQNSTALSTVYPVQFILKSHAYDARMHFLAGSPTLASVLLGQPGDLVAAKTELKITQRLRLDQHKLDDLERNLRASVTTAMSNLNGHLSASSISLPGRKPPTAANQTKFVILISSPKTLSSSRSTRELIKSEAATPPHGLLPNGNDTTVEFKKEKIDNHDDNSDEEDETSLSRLISYLATKEAAGVISIPFYPTPLNGHMHTSKQELAVLHIFPPCGFTQSILKFICPSIRFGSGASPSRTTRAVKDEHLMLIIVHND